MIQVRSKTFETNSSSVHTICICSEDEYNKWCSDKDSVIDAIKNNQTSEVYVYDCYEENIIPLDFVIEKYKKRHDVFDAEGFYDDMFGNRYPNYMTVENFDNYCNYDCLEFYESSKVVNGNKVVAFGYSGYDG